MLHTFIEEQVKKLDEVLDALSESLRLSRLNCRSGYWTNKKDFDIFINTSKSYLQILEKRIELQKEIGEDEVFLGPNDIEMIRYFMNDVDIEKYMKEKKYLKDYKSKKVIKKEDENGRLF